MICKNCGYENPDAAKFCNECGETLVADMLQVANDDLEDNLEETVATDDALPDEDGAETADSDAEVILAESEDVIPPKKHFRITKKGVLISSVSVIAVVAVIVAGFFAKNIISENKQINDVIASIDAVGTIEVSQECLDRINNATNLYNALTEDQRNKVTNSQVLINSSNTYNNMRYYQLLIAGCNFVNEKANIAIEMFSDIDTLWYNTINDITDEYNNGNYDFNTALNAYWDSLDYLSGSLTLNELAIDDNEYKLDTYLTELKNPPAQYKDAYTAFTDLYACFQPMVKLTNSVHHTFASYRSETNELTIAYKAQYGKTKAIIPEID